MITFVIRRILYSIPVLFAASVLIFVSVTGDRRSAGDVEGEPAPVEADGGEIQNRKHLNESIPVQYGYWVKDAVTNKFGTPLLQPGNHIWDDLRRVIPHTLQLVLLAEISRC